MAPEDKGFTVEKVNRLAGGGYSVTYGIGPGERVQVQLADVSDFGKTLEDMGKRLASLGAAA